MILCRHIDTSPSSQSLLTKYVQCRLTYCFHDDRPCLTCSGLKQCELCPTEFQIDVKGLQDQGARNRHYRMVEPFQILSHCSSMLRAREHQGKHLKEGPLLISMPLPAKRRHVNLLSSTELQSTCIKSTISVTLVLPHSFQTVSYLKPKRKRKYISHVYNINSKSYSPITDA